MAQTLDNSLDADQDTPLVLVTLTPSAPPAIMLPPGSRVPGTLGFASAPAVLDDGIYPAERPVILDRPAPPARPQRRLRLGWYEIAVLTLILSSAALCFYRLMWAIQP